MRPRKRYHLALATLASALLILGTDLHRRADRARWRDLDARLKVLEQAPSGVAGVYQLPQIKPSDPPKVGEADTPKPTLERKPRFLGWGRCAGRIYTDVRFADGSEFRYYCRTNNPAELSWMVRSIAADASEHRYTPSENLSAFDGDD